MLIWAKLGFDQVAKYNLHKIKGLLVFSQDHFQISWTYDEEL